MALFTRNPRRFTGNGLCLTAPQDALPAGKYGVLQNIRNYIVDFLQTRLGLTLLTGASFGSAVHTVGRLNDPTSFAATAFWRVFGQGVSLMAGPAGSYPQIDTGYSGNPLVLLPATPFGAAEPWMYVADSSRMRKFDVNGHVYPIGIAPPTTEPTPVLQPLFVSFLQDFGSLPAWVAAGASAGAVTSVFRINTTISAIYYDSGSTGNVSVVPVSMASINVDAMVNFNGVETVPVQQVCIPVATTTIAAIIYDSGTSGLCTIQPTGSLGTGQLEAPPPDSSEYFSGVTAATQAPVASPVSPVPVRSGIAIERGTAGTPPVPDVSGLASTRIRQVDFPVNCLVTLGGATETVRILSVAVGPDGVQSFRCSTASTHAAGDSITGVASFRASTGSTYIAGNTLQASANQNVITPTSADSTISGIQSPGGWTITNNWATINGRATLPDDDIHLSVRFSDCTGVQAVRLYLDIDRSVNDFTRNYYFFEWRSSDIVNAIQNSNASAVTTLESVRPTVVTNQVLSVDPATAAAQRASRGAGVSGGLPTAVDAQSSQLKLGNQQWIELHCKVRDLVQVGTDPSRTLKDISAAEILVSIGNQTGPITVSYASCWLSGGYGPNVGATGLPLAYAYRGRSSLTGERSNPSATSRIHVTPQRQQVVVTGAQIAASQCDLVDWFRIGGGLDRMTIVGTTPNSNPPVFTDEIMDAAVVGGESLRYDLFQPWPTLDKARSGTANVAGTAIRSVSGDTFNTNWAPNTPIVINGRTATLHGQPVSSTLLFVNENVGSGSAIAWSIPQPTVMGNVLPTYWGDDQGVRFACGDPNNPGTLYWTQPNDPDATSDAFTYQVSSGSEVLQNGCMFDNAPYVFSTDNLYRIIRTSAGYQAEITPCAKGLWTRWAFAIAPEGIYFLYKDGIYLTVGGSAAVSVSDQDLYPLFPHDGVAGVTVNGFVPVDMTQTTKLRLSYVGGYLYFDYKDTNGASRTLTMRTRDQSWWPDVYNSGVTARISDPGFSVAEELIGVTNGKVYLPTGTTDDGTGIAWEVDTPWDPYGDPQRIKTFGDFRTDLDPMSNTVTATPVFNEGTITLAGVSLTGNGRQSIVSDFNSGSGQLARNGGLKYTGTGSVALYVWEWAAVPKVEDIVKRGTDWSDLGYAGAKFIQGVVLRANTYNQNKTVQVQADGATAITVTMNHNGEQTIAYPKASTGWTPFTAHLVRLVSTDANPWQLYEDSIKWVFEPAPEPATEWAAQPTTFGSPGMFSLIEGVIAHISTADWTLAITYDNLAPVNVTVPNSGGVYQRTRVILPAGKGKAVALVLTSTAVGQVFKNDCSFRLVPWGIQGANAYTVVNPFGGQHHLSGAEV